MKRKKRHTTLIAAVFLLLIAAVFVLSQRIVYRDDNVYNVLVVHGYDKDYYAYKDFNKEVLATFEDEGINVNIKNLYLDMALPTSTGRDALLELRKELDEEHWKPDLILTEGDRSVIGLLHFGNNTILPEISKVPVILGALHHPEWEHLREYLNFVVFTDPIDYRTNINLAKEISGINVIEIELDYFQQDSLIRKELREAIAQPPYVDNTDLHDMRIEEEYRTTLWKDSIMVMAISAADPERNIAKARDAKNSDSDDYDVENEISNLNGDSELTGKEMLRNIYTYSYKYPSLVVKHDVYSEDIALKTRQPQFTAVKAGFANGTARYLCGYFSSYKTVAHDITSTAVKVFRGENYHSGVHQHAKAMYMDYKAMQLLNLKYSDYSDRFEIVGAPFYEAHTTLFAIIIVGTLIALALLTFAIVSIVTRWRMRSKNRLLKRLQAERAMTELALQGAEAIYINNVADVENIISHLDMFSPELSDIRRAYDQDGTHSFRLYVALFDDGIKEWWQMNFVVSHDSKGSQHISGLLRNISKLVETEQEIERAHRLRREAIDKKMLIRNMTAAINNPLEKILEASDKLVKESSSLTSEGKQELCDTINKKNQQLMEIINDILKFSRLESRKTEYLMQVHKAKDICEEIYNEWLPLIPTHIKLIRNYGRDDATVYGDATHIHEIMKQFMSNAVKFTKDDSISIGYKTHLAKNVTQLFVEDAGEGIPVAKREKIFNAFYKGDSFVQGVGLGLNIATSLAKGMGGSVSVASEVGIGSKFCVRLNIDEQSYRNAMKHKENKQ